MTESKRWNVSATSGFPSSAETKAKSSQSSCQSPTVLQLVKQLQSDLQSTVVDTVSSLFSSPRDDSCSSKLFAALRSVEADQRDLVGRILAQTLWERILQARTLLPLLPFVTERAQHGLARGMKAQLLQLFSHGTFLAPGVCTQLVSSAC